MSRTPIRATAERIAANFAQGAPHAVKVTEDAAACRASGRPVYAVFIRMNGSARGRRIASILADTLHKVPA